MTEPPPLLADKQAALDDTARDYYSRGKTQAEWAKDVLGYSRSYEPYLEQAWQRAVQPQQPAEPASEPPTAGEPFESRVPPLSVDEQAAQARRRELGRTTPNPVAAPDTVEARRRNLAQRTVIVATGFGIALLLEGAAWGWWWNDGGSINPGVWMVALGFAVLGGSLVLALGHSLTGFTRRNRLPEGWGTNKWQRIAMLATAAALALVLLFDQPSYSYEIEVEADTRGARVMSADVSPDGCAHYYLTVDNSTEAVARLASKVLAIAALGGAATLALRSRKKP